MTDTQRFADWVRDHATAATLDPLAPLDDLEPLRAVIGNARVVAIGESAHYVREFYLLRHRLSRFLVERCGFTVYALEAPFPEAQAIDAWVQGGPGVGAEVAAAGVAFDQGRARELHDYLAWMRAHNRTAARPLRFAGTGLPASGGSPLAALEQVAAYLRRADPEALPLLEQAADLVRRYHDPAAFVALTRHTALDPTAQDALTAVLSRLLARLETTATGAAQHSQQRGREHAAALQRLRGAWYLDHFHRDLAGRGIAGEHPHAFHDAVMAESVLRLLEEGPPETRIVVAAHNIHIQRTPVARDGASDLFPQGFRLAHALGADYVAIAATSHGGRAARMQMDPAQPLGFVVQDRPLPPLVAGSIEAAFASAAPVTIADLRAARPGVHDAESYQRLRMEDYFMDLPVFDAFDAVASLPGARCAEHVAAGAAGQDLAPAHTR
jgi:erythromycin esterase